MSENNEESWSNSDERPDRIISRSIIYKIRISPLQPIPDIRHWCDQYGFLPVYHQMLKIRAFGVLEWDLGDQKVTDWSETTSEGSICA